jgi:hypothetical protein
MAPDFMFLLIISWITRDFNLCYLYDHVCSYRWTIWKLSGSGEAELLVILKNLKQLWRASLSTPPRLLLGKYLLLLLRALCLSLALCSCPVIPLWFVSNQENGDQEDGENGRYWPMPSASQITNPATITTPTGRSTPLATCGTTASWQACSPARVCRTLLLARVWARGGLGRALHDGEATKTPGCVGEPICWRGREEMVAASFTQRQVPSAAGCVIRCPPIRRSPAACSPGTSLPQPVRHHLSSLSLPSLEQT